VPVVGSRPGVTSRAIGAMPSDWVELQRAFENQHKFMIERGVNYMKWRFVDCPDRQYELVEFRERTRLMGVVVCVSRTYWAVHRMAVAEPEFGRLSSLAAGALPSCWCRLRFTFSPRAL
jgi:hypothetical protein